MSTVWFTDGVLANSITSCNGVLEEYVVSAESRRALETLQKSGQRMGLIVVTRDQPQKMVEKTLAMSGLLDFFEPQLVVYSHNFNDGFLSEAMRKAKGASRQALFVGQHCDERAWVLELGFDAAIPHPLLVSAVLNGETLTYARVSGLASKLGVSGTNLLLEMPLIPFYLTPGGNQSLYVITTNKAAQTLRANGFEVTVFDQKHDPQTTDLYLAHDDRKQSKGPDGATYTRDFLEQKNKAHFIVGFVDQAVLLALPPSVSIEEIHLPNALHGHNRRLLLNTALLSLLTRNTPQETISAIASLASIASLTKTEVEEIQNGINESTIKQFHAPYVGDAALGDAGTKVESRHVLHKHNSLVTDALCKQLTQIGKGVMVPKRYNFDYQSRTLSNIVTDLPGKEANSFIIISAHFDSTAVKSEPYYPEVDIAPGANDDASGIAAVLAAATVAVKLHLAAGPLQKSLRFILFNAEEVSIIGSQKYVSSHLVGTTTKVHAVFQMDMIGHTGGKVQKEFEVHIGCLGNQEAEKNSLALAKMLDSVVTQISVLNSPQIYPPYLGKSIFDPLNGRSDHDSFLRFGYPACVVTEDSTEGPLDTSPAPIKNYDYHKKTDKAIDYTYAAEIARVVTAAAIQLAKS